MKMRRLNVAVVTERSNPPANERLFIVTRNRLKKRRLLTARLELLFVDVKHGGISRHIINNLLNVFESHWRVFVI